MTENILITGGTGFVGTHLVKELIAQGIATEQIHVTTLRKDSPHYLTDMIIETNIHEVDLTNSQKVLDLFQLIKPKHIYNLAGFSAPGASLEKKSLTLSVNTMIQLNALEAMVAFTPNSRLLSIGSGTEYAPSNKPLKETDPLGPSNPYAVSKVTQDMLAGSYAAQGLDIVRVRPFNHIGEYQERGFVVADFAYQITQEIEKGLKDNINVGNLDVRRDFTDVIDIVKGYILLMKVAKSGEIYNLGSGKDISILELLKKLQDLSTVEFQINIDDSKKRKNENDLSVADISKIKQLGWEPTIPLDITLERIVKWWREK
ncbi:MAG: GDP-mannose 4,6-dehydratase [Candidatus Pacebacteria bacterium]|nr:GDP-mannose 4,6-dehydratase [Candidatus Paceibacterota bacterium]